MKKTLFILVLGVILVSGCIAEEIPEEKYCDEDSDCVPATCCHADSCVNKDFEQDCNSIFCTMECVPDTMDCGQGYCACINNECKAVMRG